jgi:hypothetical protein
MVAIAHAPVALQWWLWDDPQLLYGAMNFRLAEHFTSPQAWQQQSTANFVPMLMLANEIDLALFGVNPTGFYLHHLLVFAAAMIALYFYVRTFAGETVAWLAAAAMALSQPAFTVSTLLMDRHYAAGLFCSAVAMILFRRGYPIAATLVYFVACLEKEVFVPLPLLVLVQDYATRSGWRTMLRNAVLCGVAAVAYVAWRIWMLGSFGGYGGGEQSLARVVTEGWTIVSGTKGIAALGVLAFAALLFALSVRRAPLVTVVIVAASAIFILLPIAGLTSLDSRYFFVATAVILALGAAAAAREPGRSLDFVVYAALCIAIGSGGIVHGLRLRRELSYWQQDGLYLWHSPATVTPLFTGANGWYIEGIQWLRRTIKSDSAPDVIASIPGLVIADVRPEELGFATPQDAGAIMRSYEIVRRHYDPSMPLTVHLTRKGSVISWKLGPAAPGDSFFFVTPIQELVWTRTPEGWVRLPSDIRVPTATPFEQWRTLRVMRRSGERWTVSEPLMFPREGGVVEWKR